MKGLFALVLACACYRSDAYVYGQDDRRRLTSDDISPQSTLTQTDEQRRKSSAVGGIVCDDNTAYSGFIIDVSVYAPEFELPVLITTAHTFIDAAGRSRGICRYLSGGRFGNQSVISRIKLGIGTGVKRKPADSGDWAMAIVNTPTPDVFARITPMFADEYDFDRPSEDPAHYVAASFEHHYQGVWMASDCRPDDKRHYPAFAATDVDAADFRRMIIHDCDYAAGGSGGPLLKRTTDGLLVIGILTGDTIERKTTPASGATYSPPDAFNFSRRLDADLEQALIRYLNSFK